MGLRAAQNGALRRPVKETQPGCQTASRTRLGFRNANCGSRRELNGKLASARAAASAATRSGANRPWPPDWSDEPKSGAGPSGTGGTGLGRGAPAGALPEERPRELWATELTPALARVDSAAEANPVAGNVPGLPANVPGGRTEERTLAGLDEPGDAACRGTLWAFGADAGGGAAAETPAAASTGVTTSLTTPAGAMAAAGPGGGAAGGESVAASAAAAFAVASSDAEETAANARSTAGCVAAAASGETALICATAELIVADTSGVPGTEPAARASPGAAIAPHATATRTQTRGENGLPVGF